MTSPRVALRASRGSRERLQRRLVLLLGVSVSVFAAVMAATLGHAQEGVGSVVLSPLATGRSTPSGQEPCSAPPTLPS